MAVNYQFGSACDAGKFYMMLLLRDWLGDDDVEHFRAGPVQPAWDSAGHRKQMTAKKTSKPKPQPKPAVKPRASRLAQSTLNFAPKAKPATPPTATTATEQTAPPLLSFRHHTDTQLYLVPMASMKMTQDGQEQTRLIHLTCVMRQDPLKRDQYDSYLLEYFMVRSGYAWLLCPDYVKLLSQKKRRRPRLCLTRQESLLGTVAWNCMQYAKHSENTTRKKIVNVLQVHPATIRWGLRQLYHSSRVKGECFFNAS